MFKLKKDTDRIGIVVYTLAFSLLAKLILDSAKLAFMQSIPSWILFVISPVIGILIAQKLAEGKLDWKEAGGFTLVMSGINFLIVWLTSAEMNIVNTSMSTTTGMVSTLSIYFINIPLSVILADIVTDKWKWKF